MCNCVISWAPDPRAETPHNAVPITCAEYIKVLEAGFDLDKLNAAREVLGLPRLAESERLGS